MVTSPIVHTIVQVAIVVGLVIFIVGFIGFALWEKFKKQRDENKGGK